MLKLQTQWETRLKLYAEGSKLCAEGRKLYAEGSKLCAEGRKLYAEGSKLYAEGSKLRAEGSKLCAEGSKLCAEDRKLRAEGDIQFFTAVIEIYGNVAIDWNGQNCIIEGDEYEG